MTELGVKIRELLNPKNINLKHLGGKVIAIDAMNVLYQFISSIIRADTGELLKSESGKITSHISGLFYRSISLIEKRINPIYVFDGKPSMLKRDTINYRKKIRDDAKEVHEKAIKEGDIKKAYKYAKSSFRVNTEMINDSKEFLKIMGIPYVQAESEGESQAAYMVEKGDAWAVGSQDYDSILFGSQILIRNLTISGKRRSQGGKIITIEPEIIKLKDVLKENNLTRDQIIDIGILIGTDFNDGIKGIGIKTALKYIKKYGDFKTICSNKNINIEWDYESIKKIFLEPKVNTNYEIKKLKPNYEKLEELLITEYNFNEIRIKNGLKRLKKGRKAQNQRNIDSFFS